MATHFSVYSGRKVSKRTPPRSSSSHLKAMRVPSPVVILTAAAELANDKAIHSDILAESFHKMRSFLGLLKGTHKVKRTESKARRFHCLDVDVHPHLHQPKALFWLSRLSARMSECAICTSFAAATDRAMTEGICMFFMQAGLTGRHSFAYFSFAVDRKVSRHEGETDCWKALKPIKRN